MENMNFLTKKYTSVHSTTQLSQSRSRSSRTFLPAHLMTQPLPLSNHRQPVSQLPPSSSPSVHSTSIASNHCPVHAQQLIRHLCLDCIELLCSECIGEHIAVHRDNGSFPNIQTLKQLRAEMNAKLEDILQYMFKEAHHPKNITANIQAIRKESSSKIDALAKQLHTQLDAWIATLRASVLNTTAHEQTRLLQQEMYALHEEVNQLINSLSSTSASAQDIKKAYQIDAERLQKCYRAMVEQYQGLRDGMKVQVGADEGALEKALEGIVRVMVGTGETRDRGIKINQEDSMVSPTKEFDLPLQFSHRNQQQFISTQVNSDVPLLYSLVSGTDTLRVVDPLSAPNCQIKTHRLQGLASYPLNSTALLPDSMLVISGGIMAQSKKSNSVQIYDYSLGRLVTQAKLSKGRSSHSTIVDGEEIYFIGGFSNDNEECKEIEVLRVDGLTVSQHKCKWGGPCLCVKINNKIIKVNISGIQSMDLATLKWQQWQLQIPFTLTKGMQIASYSHSQTQTPVAMIFGDDENQYLIDPSLRKLQKLKSNLIKPVISATTVKDQVYAWVEDTKMQVVKYQGQQKGWVNCS